MRCSSAKPRLKSPSRARPISWCRKPPSWYSYEGSMADIGWARSRGNRAEPQGLRRGAWDRVGEDPPKGYVGLDRHYVEIRILRCDIQIRRARPKNRGVGRGPHGGGP